MTNPTQTPVTAASPLDTTPLCGGAALRPERTAFYEALFGLDCALDTGWVVTLEPGCAPMAQLDAGDDMGAGIGDQTIEVENVDSVYARAVALGADVIQPPRTESWGQRRMFLRDPDGSLLHVTEHEAVESRAA